MTAPVGQYLRGLCYIQSESRVRMFADEMELERFVMRCKHVETLIAPDGLAYCVRCWAIPWRPA